VKRYLLSFFLLIFSGYLFGSGYMCRIGFTRTEITQQFKEIQKNDTAFKYSFLDKDSSLLIKIEGFEKIEFEYWFGTDGSCNRQVSKFYCCECTDTHLMDNFPDRSGYGWKLGRDGKYYSKFYIHATATYTLGQAPGPCLQVNFETNTLTKEEYKLKLHKHPIMFGSAG
jgi:hypothetical protein